MKTYTALVQFFNPDFRALSPSFPCKEEALAEHIKEWTDGREYRILNTYGMTGFTPAMIRNLARNAGISLRALHTVSRNEKG